MRGTFPPSLFPPSPAFLLPSPPHHALRLPSHSLPLFSQSSFLSYSRHNFPLPLFPFPLQAPLPLYLLRSLFPPQAPTPHSILCLTFYFPIPSFLSPSRFPSLFLLSIPHLPLPPFLHALPFTFFLLLLYFPPFISPFLSPLPPGSPLLPRSTFLPLPLRLLLFPLTSSRPRPPRPPSRKRGTTISWARVSGDQLGSVNNPAWITEGSPRDSCIQIGGAREGREGGQGREGGREGEGSRRGSEEGEWRDEKIEDIEKDIGDRTVKRRDK